MPMPQGRICNIPTATIQDWIKEYVSAEGQAYLAAYRVEIDHKNVDGHALQLTLLLDKVSDDELPLIRHFAAVHTLLTIQSNTASHIRQYVRRAWLKV